MYIHFLLQVASPRQLKFNWNKYIYLKSPPSHLISSPPKPHISYKYLYILFPRDLFSWRHVVTWDRGEISVLPEPISLGPDRAKKLEGERPLSVGIYIPQGSSPGAIHSFNKHL